MKYSAGQESFSRILVIEDDEMQRRTLTEMLQDEGFEVIACSCGVEALEEFERRRTRVAVLDLRLPDWTGLQLLDRLGDFAEHVSVIVNTAYSSYESARDALNFGAFAYVEKAGAPEELLRHVHRAVAHQLRRRNERLEAAVSENRAHLASVFRAAPVGIGLVDGHTLVEVNNRLCEMTGYEPEELIGHDFRMLYPDGSGHESTGAGADEQAVTQAVETQWQHKDGKILDVLLSRTPLDPDDPVKGVTFTALDITQAKRAEARLIESEERYRTIFENAVLGIYRTTPDGRILAANPALMRMLGYDSFEELAQRNLERDESYAPGYPRSVFKEAMETTDEIVGFEARWLRRDGATVYVRENARIVRDERGRMLYYEGTVEDITARKRAEEQLQNLFDLSLDLVCIADINTSTFVKVNPAFTNTLGYDEAELLDGPFLRFVHPDDIGSTAAVVREKLQRGHSVISFENRFRCKDGSYRWLSWTSRPMLEQGLTYAVARDVTERRKMVEALRKSEERYRLLIESAEQPIFTLSPEGRYGLMNRAGAAALGKQPQDVCGKTLWDFFPKEIADSHVRDVRQAIDSRQLVAVTRELIVQGEKRWYDVRVQPILDESQNRCALVILSDVTQAKRAEEARQQNEQLLCQAEQVAHVGSFSRDLRTDEITWSDETYRIFGYEPAEVVVSADFLLEHIHPDDRDKFVTSCDSVRQRDGSLDVEYRILRKDGQWRTVHAQTRVEFGDSGQPVRRFGAIQDVTARYEAEVALRESETRFRELAELLPQTVFEIDMEGRFLFANHSAFDSFGYDYDELAYLDVVRLFATEDQGRFMQNIRNRLAGNRFEDHEYTARRKDGTTFPVLIYSAPIVRNGQSIGLRGIALDISERQYAEHALQESKAKLESIFESSPNAIVVLDVSGTIEDCNQATLEILGLASKEEILGHDAFEFVASEDVSAAQEAMAATLEQGSAKNVELRILRQLHGVFLSEMSASVMVNQDGEVLGMVVVATDITERKRVEERLRAASNMLDLAPSSITVHDFEGRFLYANRKTFEIHGYAEHEFMALDLQKLDVPESADLIAERMAIIASRGEAAFEVGHLRKDGSSFPLEIYVKQVTWDSTPAILSIGTDITERRRAEEALRESERTLSTLMANLPGMAYRCLDDEQWTMEFVSKGCVDLTGYTSADLIRNQRIAYNDVIHPEDRRRVHENCRDSTQPDQPFELEYRITAADGQEKWVWERGRPIYTAGGERRLEGFILDVSERKRAEQALRESEERFRTLYESVHAGVVLQQADGTISHANTVACEIFGMTPETIQSKSPLDPVWHMIFEDGTSVPGDQYPAVITLRTGKPIRGAVRGLFADDPARARWLLMNTEPLLGRDGRSIERVLVTFQDITDYRHAQEALRESEYLLRQSQKVANIGHYVLDAPTGYWESSEILDTIFGISLDYRRDVEGWLSIVHPDDREEMSQYLSQHVLREHHMFNREYRIVRASDEAIRWVWGLGRLELGPDGRPLRMIGTIQDVTDRREAEEALRTASREWQTTFDSVSDVIWLLDNSFRIQRCNRATERIFGEAPEKLIGRRCWEIVHGTREPIAECPLLRLQKSHHRESMELRRGDRWLEVVVDPILSESGALDGVAHIVSDITERKAAEERLRALASELSLAEERERRHIAANLHDHACQSLALSKMKLQAVLDHALPADDSTLHQICDSLNQTLESVRELTFDLSSPTLYKFGIEAALEELLRDKLRAEYKITYRFSDDGRPKPLTPDIRVLLFQSVRELLINVIKHARAHEVRLDISREGDSIRVTVGDDGVGFDVGRVWSASSRRHSVGLFNVRERLDFVGGRLEVDSQPGHGSRFTLIAPLETDVPVAKENHDGSKDSTR